jgi:hypothetical protein
MSKENFNHPAEASVKAEALTAVQNLAGREQALQTVITLAQAMLAQAEQRPQAARLRSQFQEGLIDFGDFLYSSDACLPNAEHYLWYLNNALKEGKIHLKDVPESHVINDDHHKKWLRCVPNQINHETNQIDEMLIYDATPAEIEAVKQKRKESARNAGGRSSLRRLLDWIK